MSPNLPQITRLKDSNPIDDVVREMEGTAREMQNLLTEVRSNSNAEISGMAKELELMADTLKDLHKSIRGEGPAPGLIERVATMEERLNHARASIITIGDDEKKEKAAHIQGGYGMKIAMLGSFTSLLASLIMIILQILLKK